MVAIVCHGKADERDICHPERSEGSPIARHLFVGEERAGEMRFFTPFRMTIPLRAGVNDSCHQLS